MREICVKSVSDLPAASQKFLSAFHKHRVFAFYGEMGAGKTTFIKSICTELGVEGITSSPTFSLINEYQTRTTGRIFHFDFYRIKNETEAYDLGYEEYFYSGNYCFIEWPEKIENLLPADCVKVKIEVRGGERHLKMFS